MTSYPAGVYSPRTKKNKSGVVYDPTRETLGFAEDVTKLDDEVVAVETELGANPKWSSASIKERLKGIRSLADAVEDIITIKGGNVGIGTTEPGGSLHIDSSVSTKNMLEISRDLTGDAIKWLNYNGDDQTFSLKSTSDNWAHTFKVMSIQSPSGRVGFGYSDLTGATGQVLINGKVGIGTTAPATKLEVAGAITQSELSADPTDPAEGKNVKWQSDGTGSGDDGDIMMKITAEGVTKTVTLVDFSTL